MRLIISLILLFASLAAALAQAPAPASVEAVVKRWHVLNSDCRGSNPPISDRACDERPKVAAQLARLGWCYGEKGQIGEVELISNTGSSNGPVASMASASARTSPANAAKPPPDVGGVALSQLGVYKPLSAVLSSWI